MRLPVIKKIINFIEERDIDYIEETIEVLEYLAMSDSLKDEEIDTLAEILSNLHGSIEVSKDIENGKDKNKSLNDFMKRVIGSIN